MRACRRVRKRGRPEARAPGDGTEAEWSDLSADDERAKANAVGGKQPPGVMGAGRLCQTAGFEAGHPGS